MNPDWITSSRSESNSRRIIPCSRKLWIAHVLHELGRFPGTTHLTVVTWSAAQEGKSRSIRANGTPISGTLLALVVTILRRPHPIQPAPVVHLIIYPCRELKDSFQFRLAFRAVRIPLFPFRVFHRDTSNTPLQLRTKDGVGQRTSPLPEA